MAKAILDLHTSAEYNAALEDAEIRTTSRSGFDTDTVYIVILLVRWKGTWTKYYWRDCTFNSQHRLRLQQHVERHYVLYTCSYGYFASNCNTTAKYGRTRHHETKPGVTQVNVRHWHVAHRYIWRLPETVPPLLAKEKDSSKVWIPRKHVGNASPRYKIPKVVIASVRPGESDGTVEAPARGAEIPKRPKTVPMT